MDANATQRFFDNAIDLLIANGNCIYGDKRWSWDKEGGHCYLCRPLDLDLICRELKIPDDVTLDRRFSAIETRGEYLQLRHILPHGYTPPFENGVAPSVYSWSPLWLVHPDAIRDESAVDRAFETAIGVCGARPMLHSRPAGNRFVDQYWLSLRNAVLELRLDGFEQQPVWLSRWRFHTHSHSFPFSANVQFIAPNVTTEQPALKNALLPIAKQLAAAAKLRVWDHQAQRLLER